MSLTFVDFNYYDIRRQLLKKCTQRRVALPTLFSPGLLPFRFYSVLTHLLEVMSHSFLVYASCVLLCKMRRYLYIFLFAFFLTWKIVFFYIFLSSLNNISWKSFWGSTYFHVRPFCINLVNCLFMYLSHFCISWLRVDFPLNFKSS